MTSNYYNQNVLAYWKPYIADGRTTTQVYNNIDSYGKQYPPVRYRIGITSLDSSKYDLYPYPYTLLILRYLNMETMYDAENVSITDGFALVKFGDPALAKRELANIKPGMPKDTYDQILQKIVRAAAFGACYFDEYPEDMRGLDDSGTFYTTKRHAQYTKKRKFKHCINTYTAKGSLYEQVLSLVADGLYELMDDLIVGSASPDKMLDDGEYWWWYGDFQSYRKELYGKRLFLKREIYVRNSTIEKIGVP